MILKGWGEPKAVKKRWIMKLVVCSDLHYASETPVHNTKSSHRKLWNVAVPLMEKFIHKIDNDIKPDAVVFLGDFIEDLQDYDKDIRNFSFIWKLIKNMKTPFYSVVGNHDLRTVKNEDEIKNIMEYENLTYSINIKGYHLVFLGLTISEHAPPPAQGGIHRTRYISDKNIKWLKNDLKQNNLPVLIFHHFGIAEDNMKGNYWFGEKAEMGLLGNRTELKEILKADKNILAVFSGHQHWTKKLTEDGIDYYVIGALTENVNDDGIPDGVYFEVDLEDKEIKVSHQHL